MLGPVYDFKQYGRSGAWVSDLLPNFATVVDEVSFLKAMYTDQFNHAPAELFLHTGNARAMRDAVLFSEKYSLKPVLVGAEDAWLMADFLKLHEVPVILSRTHRLPAREDEDIDQPYKTAAQLHEKGVVFAFSDISAWQQRNVAFQAGQAVGFGLPAEAAVQALTLHTARILGIDERCGSLSTGKDATLFISEGDALDMRSSQVTAAFIQGREINLDNKQKQLYRRFEGKYKQ